MADEVAHGPSGPQETGHRRLSRAKGKASIARANVWSTWARRCDLRALLFGASRIRLYSLSRDGATFDAIAAAAGGPSGCGGFGGLITALLHLVGLVIDQCAFLRFAGVSTYFFFFFSGSHRHS